MSLPERSLMKLAKRFHTRAIETRNRERQSMSLGLQVNCERLVDQREKLANGSAHVALTKPIQSDGVD